MRIAWVVALLAALAGCAALRGAPSLPDCPGELVPPSQIPGNFLLRLRMRVRAEAIDTSLELAVQKRGDELVMVAFDPVVAVAFHVTQSAGGVEVERRLPAALVPVPPLNVLRDVHRARFGDQVRVELDNRACGYRASVIELSRQELP